MSTRPSLSRLYGALDVTWPCAARVDAGPWCLREGRGGGKRVSAATAIAPWRVDDLTAAETAMRLMSQPPLFMIRAEDETLDVALDAQGYDKIDPVHLWLAPVTALTDRKLPRVAAFAIWEPLAIMREIWEDGGIDASRQRIMERAEMPKTGLFGRVNDRPAGAGFCAMDGDIAMVHGLHILEYHRGKGLGGWMMRCAALWAQSQGARWIACAATQDNAGASALYASLQMQIAGSYHYRILSDAESETP